LRQRSVLKLGRLVQISLTLGAAGGLARFFELRLQVVDRLDDSALALPLRFQPRDFFLQLADFGVNRLESIAPWLISCSMTRTPWCA